MNAAAPVPTDHPMMQAWESYQITDEYANTWRWAATGEEYVKGSLWAAFVQGWLWAGGSEPFAATPRVAGPAEPEDGRKDGASSQDSTDLSQPFAGGGGVPSASFTPGPWMVTRDPCHFGSLTTIEAGDSPGATRTVAEATGKTLAECEANARLIAAAPELYEALKAFVEPHDGTGDEALARRMHESPAVMRIVKGRAALAKALGASPASSAEATLGPGRPT